MLQEASLRLSVSANTALSRCIGANAAFSALQWRWLSVAHFTSSLLAAVAYVCAVARYARSSDSAASHSYTTM